MSEGSKPLRILIIDDSPEDRALYRRFLTRDPAESYLFVEADSGEEGITLCQSETPDCVLLDYRLPDVDGLEVLNRLVGSAGMGPVPIVMLTGFGSDQVDREVMQMGAQDYLVKGQITEVILRRTIRHAIERYRLLTDLQEDEERFRLAVEAAPTAMIMVDEAGKISLANSQTETLFGYTAGELVGKAVEVLIPEHLRDHHPGLRESFFTAGQSRPLGSSRELLARHKDGTNIPVEIGLNFMHTREGDFVLASVLDITERKRAEAAHKLFLAATSHDIRNSLGVILGYAEMLAEPSGKTLPVDASARIHKLVKTLAGMMDDIVVFANLDFSSDLTVEPVEVRELISDCTHYIQKPCERAGLHLNVELPAEGTIQTDRVKLLRIVQNLLGNAVRYTAEGEVSLSASLTDDELRIRVMDTGIGIPGDCLEAVFEPYYRHASAKEAEPLGTGIGLTIVKRLCALLGATVTIDSTVAVGTTFTITLPRKPLAA
jgi:PAS domain S-box-containing protein